jgi:hypothetical protein
MPLQPAVLGTARLANFRIGYLSAVLVAERATQVSILLAGVEVRTRVRLEGFTIHHALGDSPSTCSLTMDGTAPVAEQRLRVTINRQTPRLLFAGALQTVDETYEGRPAQVAYPCTAIDDTARANRRRPFGTWTTTSATTIALALVAACLPDYSTAGIVAGLPTVSVNLDGSEGISGALQQLATLIGGYWHIDDLTVSLFQTDTSSAPDPIDSTHPFLNDPPITMTRDVSQLLTRVFGKGHGEPTLAAVAAGATVIPVANAAAWFNPAGGKVISDTQILTYTGIGWGYTKNPATWQAQASAHAAEQWAGVAWSPELGIFVAVSASSSPNGVMTSPDGVTWTHRTPAANVQWEDVAWSPALTLFVAVSIGGQVMSSPDGVVWTSRTASVASGWSGIAWSPAQAVFVAVADSGAGARVMRSSDGITWVSQTAAAVQAWERVLWAPALGLFIACSSNTLGTGAIMTSPTGVTWTLRTTSDVAWNLAWSPTLGVAVAVGSTGVMTSTNGTTWTTHASALPAGSWYGAVWADVGYFVAIGTAGIGVSVDGIMWTIYTPPAAGTWRALAWAPSLGVIVAVGYTATPVSLLATNTSPFYGTLTGVPPSGVGSIAVPLVQGAPVNLWVQRDDAAAQAVQAAIDTANGRTPADGIYEGPPLVDERRNEASLIALCDATLARFASPIVSVTYATRDVKTQIGKTVHINLASPAIGPIDLVIQDVTISEIDVVPSVAPKFTVMASSVRFSLPDLLRRLLAA